MKKPLYVILAGAIAMAGMSAPLTAIAEPFQQTKPEKLRWADGLVASWTPETRMLKLRDGDVFQVDPSIVITELKFSDKVSVGWVKPEKVKIARLVTVK